MRVFMFAVVVMKMGNFAPRAGFEPNPLAFQSIVLTITAHRFPDVITISTRTRLCNSLPERSVQTTICLYLCVFFCCII